MLDVYTYDCYPEFAFEIDRDPLHKPMKNLYSGEPQQGTITLPPYGTAVWEEAE